MIVRMGRFGLGVHRNPATRERGLRWGVRALHHRRNHWFGFWCGPIFFAVWRGVPAAQNV